ncbi:periplasmic heavy metal sensor [uncultured Ferrimonas sp.]|uniref:Spy/CpxP family protein refolding chaperone n=1 Tax=uncultured Ferrimonas sp. TaxID=432640 RepID=UPI002603FA7E|nr:periplasmic heavy metal sensor [uncultured Ferrimonas sp.]
MKRSTKIGLAALVLFSSVGAYAGHGHDGHDRQRGAQGIHKMLFDLDLSSEQRAEIRTILKTAKTERKQHKSQPSEAAMSQHRAAMQALMDASQFDAVAAAALVEQRQTKQQQRAIKGMQLRHQVMQVLTQAQRDELYAKQQQRQQRHSGKCADKHSNQD